MKRALPPSVTPSLSPLHVTESFQADTRDSSSQTPRTFLNRRRSLSRRERAEKSRWVDVWDLMKPEISFLVVLSAFAGYLLGSPAGLDGWLLVHTLLGTALTALGSGALNHFIERHLDGQMRRTFNRPLPAGRMSPAFAMAFGVATVTYGTIHLLFFVNTLTAVLAGLTVGLYIAVYTPLKRITKYNTIVGCIPGALPALGGWAAATGTVSLPGWILFGILFTWQMPHFLALAWMYRADYARADFAMLPVIEPSGHSTAVQVMAFTVLLVLISLLPFTAGLSGWLYLIGALGLGAGFLHTSFRFYASRSNQHARSVLLASIAYIPALVGFILVDWLL